MFIVRSRLSSTRVRRKNTLHGSGAMADANPLQLLVSTPEPEIPAPAELRWSRPVCALFRIRRLQRI